MIHQINSSRNVFFFDINGTNKFKRKAVKKDILLTLFKELFGHFAPLICLMWEVIGNGKRLLGRKRVSEIVMRWSTGEIRHDTKLVWGNTLCVIELKIMGHYDSHISDINPQTRWKTCCCSLARRRVLDGSTRSAVNHIFSIFIVLCNDQNILGWL